MLWGEAWGVSSVSYCCITDHPETTPYHFSRACVSALFCWSELGLTILAGQLAHSWI